MKLAPERRETIRAYIGHFPFFVTELLGVEVVRLAILRHPVDRTISYLKHCKRHHAQHKELALEEIYVDPSSHPTFIANHQTKVFSMTAEDRLQSIMEVLDIDDNRERIACANLENVDVLGLHEHYDEFIEEIRSRFGWKFEKVPNWFVGNEPWQASDELRQRIAADNAADVRLYKHARRLHAQRRERPGAPLS